METLWLCMIAGFAAQMVDGSLGMGYGIILSIVLGSLGFSPIYVSASVHLAKFFAAGTSGFSHWKMGNIDKAIVFKLSVGGILGAIIGALVLKSLPLTIIKPAIAIYLLGMGFFILYKAQHKPKPRHETRHVTRLGWLGGFADAIGGGGWGAIVTSGLLVKGKDPRVAIGSVSLAEFFVAITVIGVLITEIPEVLLQAQAVVGLILGSAIAAPIAAYVCGRIAPRPLMVAVGSLIVLLNISAIISALPR